MAKKLTKKYDNCGAVCDEISTSQLGLLHICKKHKMSSATFYQWLDLSPENEKRYTRAREQQADMLFDEMLNVANHREEDHTPFTGTNVIQRDRLIIDTMKFAAAKLRPKKYGDKIDITSANEKISTISPEILLEIKEQINKNSHLYK